MPWTITLVIRKVRIQHRHDDQVILTYFVTFKRIIISIIFAALYTIRWRIYLFGMARHLREFFIGFGKKQRGILTSSDTKLR